MIWVLHFDKRFEEVLDNAPKKEENSSCNQKPVNKKLGFAIMKRSQLKNKAMKSKKK